MTNRPLHQIYLEKKTEWGNPDPAVYCPANGFVDPNDPVALGEACTIGGYIPDPAIVTFPDYIPTPDPSADKISLLCTDEGLKKVAFSASANSGTCTMNVYGLDNDLVHSHTFTGATNYTFISSEGFPSSTGEKSYRIEIVPTTPTSHLTSFTRATIAGIDQYPWHIIQAKFNTPYLTSMSYCLYGQKYLKSVSFHSAMNSITTISNNFGYCPSLVYLEVPASTSVTTLQNYANYSTALVKVKFNGELPVLQNFQYAFDHCALLTRVDWPSSFSFPSLTQAGGLFAYCTSLKSLDLPAFSQTTGCDLNSIFKGCSSLETANFANQKVNVGIVSIVEACTALKSVTLPISQNPVTITAQSAFKECTALTKVNIPNTLKLSTVDSICYNCSSLQEFTFPTSCPGMTTCLNSFYQCYSLITLAFPTDSVLITTLSSTFWKCYCLTSITFPVTLNSCLTAANMCQYCTSLTSITLPTAMNACTTFASGFQYSTSITSITMPASMNACTTLTILCSGCTALTSLTLPTALPAITTIAQMLANCNNVLTVSECAWPSNQVNADVAFSSSMNAVYQPTLRANIIQLHNATPTDRLTSFVIDFVNSVPTASYLFSGAQFDVTELNRIYTALPTVTGTKYLTVSGCPGYAASTKTIATAKGWTVN